jgi:ribosomal protein S18 acetylase RimI-like enzyme
MIDKVVFSVNQSSTAEIAAHLLGADAAFQLTLSSRVEFLKYAQKLQDRAVRFEAWLGEELVGLVASYCNQLDGGKSFVTSVSVWPKCQGLGIADQLIRKCIEHARGLGFGRIELEVSKQSFQAIALYQKLGFIILGSSGSILTMGMIIKQKAI